VSKPVLHVDEAGPLTTVQDLGRPGLASLGVPESGALDPRAL
jgi:allophanate hydrolase subunit 2